MAPLRTDSETDAMKDDQTNHSPQHPSSTEVWEEDTNDDSATPPPDVGEFGVMEPPTKKRRKDVSPDKYFEILEEDNSSKYGCSVCGNVYKWRKSLNKHWKEKHLNDPGNTQPTPPGMNILLQQGNYVQTRPDARQVFHKMLLEKITVKQGRTVSVRHSPKNSPELSDSSPTENRSTVQEMDGNLPVSYASTMPKGPFSVGSSCHPVFSVISEKLLSNLHSPFPSSTCVDLSPRDVDEPDGMDDAVQPLDFSSKQASSSTPLTSTPVAKPSLSTAQKVLILSPDQLGTAKESIKDLKMQMPGETVKMEQSDGRCVSVDAVMPDKYLVKCPMCPKQFPALSALELHFLNCHTVCTDLSKINQAVSQSSEADYEMEEGEIDPNHPFRLSPQSSNTVSPSSFLLQQTTPQKMILVSAEASAAKKNMQPNFLDETDNAHSASSSTSPIPNGEGAVVHRIVSLQGLSPTASSEGESDTAHGGGSTSTSSLAREAVKSPAPAASREDILRSLRKRSAVGKAKIAVSNGDKVQGNDSSQKEYKCEFCNFRAKWPNMVMEHMKIHSSPKPYRCPNCSYASKWKWDVSKHLLRCGSGGKLQGVIDDSTNQAASPDVPPNVTVTPDGVMVQHQKDATAEATGSADTHSVTTPSPDQPLSLQTALAVSTSTHTTILPQQFLQGTSMQVVTLKESSHAAAASPSPHPSGLSLVLEPKGEQPSRFSPLAYTNENQHRCLICSFSCSTATELTRHQVTHSEKPYRCDRCTYATKWKHDLKKHKCKGLIKGSEPSREPQKSDSFKCSSCPFETSNKKALNDHVRKNHSSGTSSSKKSAEVVKFRCKQCQFNTNDFSRYVQHRQSHVHEKDVPRQCSPVNDPEELDEARLKHPRKKVTSYSCKRCNFVCTKSTELLDHRREVHDIYQCLYCSERFDVKDGLLDHLLHVHPDVNIAEWCLYFRVDNDEDVNNNSNAEERADVSKEATGHKTKAADMPVTASVTSDSKQKSDEALRCSWCGHGFENIVRLYSHVQSVHKQQFVELQVEEGIKPSDPQGQKAQFASVSPTQGISLLKTSTASAEQVTASLPTNGKEGSTLAKQSQAMTDGMFRVPSLPNSARKSGTSHGSPHLSHVPSSTMTSLDLSTKNASPKSPALSPQVNKPTSVRINGQHMKVQPTGAFVQLADRKVVDVQQYRWTLWKNQDISQCLLCFKHQESPLAAINHLKQQHPDFVKGVKWPDQVAC